MSKEALHKVYNYTTFFWPHNPKLQASDKEKGGGATAMNP